MLIHDYNNPTNKDKNGLYCSKTPVMPICLYIISEFAFNFVQKNSRVQLTNHRYAIILKKSIFMKGEALWTEQPIAVLKIEVDAQVTMFP